MRVYGLTGGIGSGKSTVANLLAAEGAAIVDADEVARFIVTPGSVGLQRVVDAFGEDVLDPSGMLDRKRLAARVFGNEPERLRLNAILHPLIAAESALRFVQLRESGAPVAIYEAALLVENGAYRAFDGLIVVEASPVLQAQRVVARGGMSANDAAQRIHAQASIEERRAVATFVVINDGAIDELRAQVRALYPQLLH